MAQSVPRSSSRAVSSSAARSGIAAAIAPRRPAGIAARRRQIAPAPPGSIGPPASTLASIAGSRSARLVFTSMPTAEVTIDVGARRQRREHPAEGLVDGGVDVVERVLERASR